MKNNTADQTFVKFRSSLREFSFIVYGMDSTSWHDYDRNIWLVSLAHGADFKLYVPQSGSALVIRRAYFQVTEVGRLQLLLNFLTHYALDNNIPQIRIECVCKLLAPLARKYGFVNNSRGVWVKHF